MTDPMSTHRRLSIPCSLGFVACLVTALCLPFGAMLAAEDGPASKDPTTKAKSKKKTESEAKIVITGSLIPEKIKPNRIPATAWPVTIIGQKDIERSGAATLQGVRRKQIGR